MLAAAAALALTGGHPVKVAGLLGAAIAVRRFGLALVPAYLALAILLPEPGGPFPAILSVPDLLFWPLLLDLVLSPKRLPRSASVLAAGTAIAAASVWALAIGVLLRGAPLRPSFFTAYQQSVHVAALLLAAAAVRSGVGPARLLGGITAGGGLAAIVGLVQVAGGESILWLQQRIAQPLAYPAYDYAHVDSQLWWGVRKAFAFYYSPNGLGAALVFCFLLTVGRQLREASRARLGLAVLLGAGLVVTFSRGALLAAAATLAWLAWREARDRRFVASAALGASAILFPVLYAVLLYGSTRAPAVEEAIGGTGSVEAAVLKRRSAEMKLDEAKQLLGMWSEGRGFVGAGHGVLFREGVGFFEAAHAVQISPAYAEVLYRSGIVGALALAAAVVSLRRVWRARGRGHPLQPALLGALAHSVIDHPFLTVPGLVTVFWAGWGLLEADED